MDTAVSQPASTRIPAHQIFEHHGNRIYGQGGPDASACVAECATSEDARVLADLLNSFQEGAGPAPADRPEWFERRGNMVYGEDKGPGSAPCIATCKGADDANTVVMLLRELVS